MSEILDQGFWHALERSNTHVCFVTETNGRIAAFNCAAETLIGYPREKVVGKKTHFLKDAQSGSLWQILTRSRQRKRAARASLGDVVKEALRGQAAEHECNLVTRAGVRHRLRWSITPLEDEEGRVVGLLWMTSPPEQGSEQSEEQALAQTVLAQLPGAVLLLDTQGRITGCNASAQEFWGYSAEEMSGSGILRFIPLDRNWEGPLLMQRLKSGKPFQFEAPRTRKDGSVMDVAHEMFPLCTRAGDTTAVVLRARAATGGTAGNERSGANKRRLATEGVGTFVWEYNVASQALQFCPKVLRRLGLEAEAFEGTVSSLLLLMHPHDRELFAQTLNQCVTDGEGLEQRCRLKTADNAYVWFLFRGAHHAGGDSVQPTVLGTLQDVGESVESERMLRSAWAEEKKAHRRAKAALRVRVESQSITARQGRIGGWHWCSSTGEVVVSDELKALLGIQSFTGAGEELLQIVGEEMRPRFKSVLQAMRENGAAFDLEVPVAPQHPASSRKEIKWLRARGEAEMKEGTLVYVRGSFQDVSLEKSEAEHASELLARVVGTVRTSLNSVDCALRLLEQGGESGAWTPVQREFLSAALVETERLGDLTEQIFELGEQSQKIEPAPVTSLSALLDKIVMRLAPVAARSGVGVNLTVQGAGPYWIEGDAMRLGSAVGQLVLHAIARAPRDTSVQVHVSEGCAGKHRVSVSDEGPTPPANFQALVVGQSLPCEGADSFALLGRITAAQGGKLGFECSQGPVYTCWVDFKVADPGAYAGLPAGQSAPRLPANALVLASPPLQRQQQRIVHMLEQHRVEVVNGAGRTAANADVTFPAPGERQPASGASQEPALSAATACIVTEGAETAPSFEFAELPDEPSRDRQVFKVRRRTLRKPGPVRALFVETERAAPCDVRAELESHGIQCTVAGSGAEAVERAMVIDPDLLVMEKRWVNASVGRGVPAEPERSPRPTEAEQQWAEVVRELLG